MRIIATLALASALACAGISAASAQAVPVPSARPPVGQPPATAPAASATAAAPIDLNSAAPAELEALPGIGKARSEAIVKGRPYKGKDDLVQRKILSQSVYDGIKDRIVARQATRH